MASGTGSRTQLTVEQYLQLVVRAGLLEEAQVKAHFGDTDLSRLTRQQAGQSLVDAGLLTSWQNARLQEGRWKGILLGKYEVLKMLGVGGMGVVYLGKHRSLENQVAIKILPRERLVKPTAIHRFHREARIAAQLNHPNITRTFDFDCFEDTHFLVMEYVSGRSLQDIVLADGPLSFERAADYLRQALEGLKHAHESSLIHRDIKPSNLMVDDRDVVKILDFGLALVDDDDQAGLTAETSPQGLGTADYVAPEQAIDSHSVDGRADLYSLGHALYFMLTGRPPFPEGTKVERIIKHCTMAPQSLAELRPDVPQGLFTIWQRLTRKKPDNRFASADEALQALKAWIDSGSFGPASLSSDSSLRNDSGFGAELGLEELQLVDSGSDAGSASAGGAAGERDSFPSMGDIGSDVESAAAELETLPDPSAGNDFWDDLLDESHAMEPVLDAPAAWHASTSSSSSFAPTKSGNLSGGLRARAQRKETRKLDFLKLQVGEYPVWLCVAAGLILGLGFVLVYFAVNSAAFQNLRFRTDKKADVIEVRQGEDKAAIGSRECD